MNLTSLSNDELLNRYDKLTGKVSCFNPDNIPGSREWLINFIIEREKPKVATNKRFHITDENTEDTYDSVETLKEAIYSAKKVATQSVVGNLINVEDIETGKVVKQYKVVSTGKAEEIIIEEPMATDAQKDYEKTWKSSTKIQIDRVSKILTRFNELVTFLNDYEGVRIAYIETPKVTVGKHTYGPITLDVYLRFDVPKDTVWIPKSKRNDLMVLVGLLSEKYDIIKWETGFSCHIVVPSHVGSICWQKEPKDTEKELLESSPILKITLAIEEPKFADKGESCEKGQQKTV